jgi:hypothetical protein
LETRNLGVEPMSFDEAEKMDMGMNDDDRNEDTADKIALFGCLGDGGDTPKNIVKGKIFVRLLLIDWGDDEDSHMQGAHGW